MLWSLVPLNEEPSKSCPSPCLFTLAALSFSHPSLIATKRRERRARRHIDRRKNYIKGLWCRERAAPTYTAVPREPAVPFSNCTNHLRRRNITEDLVMLRAGSAKKVGNPFIWRMKVRASPSKHNASIRLRPAG